MLHYNTFENEQQRIVLHLHATAPEIMIATRNDGYSFVFDLKKVRVDRMDVRFQMLFNMEGEKCTIIEEDEEELYLMFGSKEDKVAFDRRFKLLCQAMIRIPKALDSEIVKSFVKADTNKNLTLSSSELINLLHDLKLKDESQIKHILG